MNINLQSAIRTFSCVVSISLFTYSCSKEDIQIDEITQEVVEKEPSLEIVDSKLMQNPYSISNIRAAYAKVVSEMNKGAITTGKGGFTSKEVDTALLPNYLYVRFDPKNDVEEGRLMAFQDILVIDYPFEYDNSEHYRSVIPAAPGKTNSYWASVPVGQNFPPNVAMTILEEMYIPEKDPDYDINNGSGKLTSKDAIGDKIDFMNHVVNAAFEATGNEELIPPVAEKGESCETCFLGINFRDKWRPSGRLMINDNTLGTIPMVGVNVLVRDTWTLDSQITGADGRFTFKELRAKVKYIIQWDRHEFSIRDDSGLTQAEDVSADKLYKEAWNKTITGGREKYRGEIFQAALDFYYNDIEGLGRPARNALLKTQMKIAAVEDTGTDSHKQQFRAGGILPVIKIKNYGLSSESVYGTTIHELAHSAHWVFDSAGYNKLVWDGWLDPAISNGSVNYPGPTGSSARRTLESWARAVEISLTRIHYRRLGRPTYEYRVTDSRDVRSGNYQSQLTNDPNFNNSRFYTSAIWDLHDDFNQRAFGNNRPQDNVSGISMVTLQRAMVGSTSWNGLRDRVISLFNRPVEVTELFANWNGL